MSRTRRIIYNFARAMERGGQKAVSSRRKAKRSTDCQTNNWQLLLTTNCLLPFTSAAPAAGAQMMEEASQPVQMGRTAPDMAHYAARVRSLNPVKWPRRTERHGR